MVKHTQTIQTNCLRMFDHFVGLALKVLEAYLGPIQISTMDFPKLLKISILDN